MVRARLPGTVRHAASGLGHGPEVRLVGGYGDMIELYEVHGEDGHLVMIAPMETLRIVLQLAKEAEQRIMRETMYRGECVVCSRRSCFTHVIIQRAP